MLCQLKEQIVVIILDQCEKFKGIEMEEHEITACKTNTSILTLLDDAQIELKF